MDFLGMLHTTLLVLVVILIFNVIIFVHELGHFLAAKWRGMKVERFQIWFGKPLWKKTIHGVQYGLGWIPAGGFVALPQLAPMEAIEGRNLDSDEPLPPVSPLDKIIVAFAGPLFSFLLAVISALILTAIKKPVDVIRTTTIGWVEKGSPAEQAGLRRGDRILAIDDEKVTSWSMPLDSVLSSIITSNQSQIKFTIERPGSGLMEVESGYKIQPASGWQRKNPRQVGIVPMDPPGEIKIRAIDDQPNTPARLAGFKPGDVVLAINGTPVVQYAQVIETIAESQGQPQVFRLRRGDQEIELPVTPVKPLSAKTSKEMAGGYRIGVFFDAPDSFERDWIREGPVKQIIDPLRQMWMALSSVASPSSSIGIEHLSGPVGIGKIQFLALTMDHPFRRTLVFMVLINVNLALLNLLPFPVLDGGHIVISAMEAIARRPISVRFLEALQMVFVLLLFGVFLYVTSKDVVDDFGMGGGKQGEIVYPPPASPKKTP